MKDNFKKLKSRTNKLGEQRMLKGECKTFKKIKVDAPMTRMK
jgi:hypothetical protein